MPSHTVHSALVQLYLDSGAPWAFPRWKEITKISHGIFPDNDDPLPKGLTRDDLIFIRSYIDQFSKKVKEDDKIKFASATSNSAQLPGRGLWRRWVTECWKDWKIHARVIQVLKSEGHHPLTLALALQEEGDAVSNSKDLVWPGGAAYIPLVVDAVALELFGAEAFNAHGLLPMKTRTIVQALVQRTWKVVHNQVDRSQNRIGKLEDDAIEAFEALSKGSPTTAEVKKVIVKVARWRDLTEFLQSKHNLEMMDSMKHALGELMRGLGAKVEPSVTKPKTKLCKVAPQTLQSLSQQEGITDVLAMYHDFFSCPSAEDSVDLTEQHPTVPFRFGELEHDADPGVEMESLLTPDILASNLGFKDGLPLLFNRYRHRGGLTTWDVGNNDLFDDVNAQKDPDMNPIVLHWHQLAGVHALVRMVFSAEPNPDRCCGALVADEVGLGKTYQAVATMAFLTDIVLRQKVNGAMPPIIQLNPYARDQDSLLGHDCPHLVVVPGTLLSQWEVEMKSVIKGGTFAILLYSGGKGRRDHFWGPDGPYAKAKHTGANIVIIAAHSALQKDFSLLYSWTKPKADLPWADPPRLLTYDALVPSTLYGRRYLSVTLDEAQGYRNVGAKHSSALILRQLTLFFFALTATPLQTSTKDIAAMARIIGIRHFLGETALDEEKSDTSALRRAKGEIEDGADGDGSMALVACQTNIAHRMQQQFEGRVLRRTIESKNWAGKRLIPLPPCNSVRLVLKLTDRELEIISQLADDVKDSVSVTNGLHAIASRSFYIEHRMSVNFARRSTTEKIPTFKTLEEWEQMKSTKIDACVRLCRHLLSRDDAAEVYVEDGALVLPPSVVPDSGRITQRRKVIIYQEFPSNGPLLRNILNLYGIKHLYLDGQTSFAKRAKIVKEFSEGTECRVLIISAVGSTGLNLSAASVMILLDQPWSAQDERQIQGRIHRQPQKWVVTLYHLLGDETADIVLASMASGKGTMMQAFGTKASGQELKDLLSGVSLVADGDDCDDDDPDVKELKRAKAKAASATKKAERAMKAAAKVTKSAERAQQAMEKAILEITRNLTPPVDAQGSDALPGEGGTKDRGDTDNGLPPLGGDLTTDGGDTSDGDYLTNGATTDGLSEPYDADLSMVSSRAPSPSLEADRSRSSAKPVLLPNADKDSAASGMEADTEHQPMDVTSPGEEAGAEEDVEHQPMDVTAPDDEVSAGNQRMDSTKKAVASGRHTALVDTAHVKDKG